MKRSKRVWREVQGEHQKVWAWVLVWVKWWERGVDAGVGVMGLSTKSHPPVIRAIRMAQQAVSSRQLANDIYHSWMFV